MSLDRRVSETYTIPLVSQSNCKLPQQLLRVYFRPFFIEFRRVKGKGGSDEMDDEGERERERNDKENVK